MQRYWYGDIRLPFIYSVLHLGSRSTHNGFHCECSTSKKVLYFILNFVSRGLVGIAPYKLSHTPTKCYRIHFSDYLIKATQCCFNFRYMPLTYKVQFQAMNHNGYNLVLQAVIDQNQAPQFQTEMETGYSSSPTTKKCSPGSIMIKPTSLALERCSQGLNTNPISVLSPAFSSTLWKPTNCLTGLPLLGFSFLANSNTGCFPAIFPLFFATILTENFIPSQIFSPSSETNLASGVCVAFDGRFN